LALMAAVAENLVLARLELAAAQGLLEFSDRHISFKAL
jgi:hypothetical protein